MKDYQPLLFFGTLWLIILFVAMLKIRDLSHEVDELKTKDPIIIYQVDNTGTEMFGKVTAKDVVDGHYYVEVKPYGKFLVTKEQYEEIEIGQEMPEWLKGRKE
ncbi:phage protein [Streptococcus suis]|uniref:Phage protein n=1 Tax=Streptococcus suis TaxID=1307 RepID=A0A0Z8G599_STRSU|nr:DUF1372 family protein [Streptococcus suis]NQH36823.1 DUF1372 family protein [Streptococcus suis]NQM05519.1 DUF1372 family protein [Streptococcus suis]NQM28859.1 DUF1372 family protein [Streptococcus suis]CYU92423.1 phage protein [Streptococcus suis]HEL1658494.1 DUF1372 family protein [Streptococcus suis]